MSSDRIERKRKSEFDTSDNSADELPAVKIRKLDSAISIGKKVSQACKNLLNWITPEFVKKMAVRVSRQSSSSSLRMGAGNSYINQYPIDMDDEEECAVIGAQNGTGAHSKSANALRMDSHSKSTRRSSSAIIPMASTPFSFPLSPENPLYQKISQTVERRKVNGFPVGSETPREDVRRSRRSETCIAPVTNPRTEIDILLEKDKEVEIINEVYPAKHSSGPTRKTRLLSGDIRVSKSDRTSCVSDFVNNRTPSSYYSTRSYTVNEVVRLQEKAQYGLLLDKVVKRMPIFESAFPKKDPQASSLLDLTDDEDLSGAGCHFKKEKVEMNVNDFLNKYYKPCDPFSRSAKRESQLSHTQSMWEREINDDDDDIQIIVYPELPKLKPREPSVSNGGIFSAKWIEDMKKSMISDTEKMLQSVSENEGKVQRYKKRREAKNAEEMRKREELRLAGFIFPEDVEMDEEALPGITPEMNSIIDMALARGDNKELLSALQTWRGEIVTVNRGDVATLANLNWLNDQVMNFYFDLIENRSKLDGYPNVHCFTTFFYSKLKAQGPYKGLLRWTRKRDIFANDLLIVPLHIDVHWALLVVDNRVKKMTYYDSMGNAERHCMDIVENYLRIEMLDKKKLVMEPNTYSFETAQNIPKQMNGSDCGMFTVKYAEYISRDAPITFTQENMPYFRRRMVYEIMTKQLL